jgi:hypothetical protein
MTMNISATLRRTLDNLDTGNVSASAFAFVAGIPLSTMTAAFRGRLNLGSEVEAELLTLSVRVADVILTIRPFTIERGDWALLKRLVESDKSVETIQQTVSSLFDEAQGLDGGTF